LPSISLAPTCTEILLTIEVQTDKWPQQNTWGLFEGPDSVAKGDGSRGKWPWPKFDLHEDQVRLCAGTTYE